MIVKCIDCEEIRTIKKFSLTFLKQFIKLSLAKLEGANNDTSQYT